jgi:hypothetical protein
MLSKPRDGLLAAAKVIIVLCQIVFIFAMVMLGIGIGAILTVGRTELLTEIATAGAGVPVFSGTARDHRFGR